MVAAALARNPLFEGLDAGDLEELAWLMQPKRFAAGDVMCEAGEAGDSLFVITEGVARVLVTDPDGNVRAVARLRRGDVIGEMSLLTGEQRSATVVAGTRATALELARTDFAELIRRYPNVLLNLNRILSSRLARTTSQAVEQRTRGEAVALLVGESVMRLVPEILAATEAASPRPVAGIDARLAAEHALGSLDDLLADHGTAVLVADLDTESLSLLVDTVDRTVAVVGDEAEMLRLGAFVEKLPWTDQRVEVVVLAPTGGEGRRTRGAAIDRTEVVRVLERGSSDAAGLAWLGRHLSRTKVGLALGAGGAKGYAHIGALAVLAEAGYAIDCVSGSSIGAMVGSWLALGMGVPEIDATMRHAFRPDVVGQIFKLSLTGKSTGVEAMTEVLGRALPTRRSTTC